VAKPLLTAALIVRDEESCLEDCLKSIGPVVDEIVVADTGSTDGSREIARRHGAAVFDFPWTDDFSAARNAGLERAHGNWILYIDADERLRPISRQEVATLLSDEDVVAHRVRFHAVTGYTAYREFRIFRNDPRIRFARAMHETVVPAIRAIAAETGARIGDCALTLDHIGYDGDQIHKHRRNLGLLEKQLALTPGEIYHWHHLGRVREALGDEAGAVAAWTRALALSQAKIAKDNVACLPYIDLLRHGQQKGLDVADLAAEAAALFPGNKLVNWIRARLAMDRGDFSGAVVILESLAAVDADTYTDESMGYHRDIFEIDAYEALGICHFRLSDWKASANWFSRALACAPARRDIEVRLALARARSENPRAIAAV
jgi:tetratricopeptide (TPR) repeat protein